MTIDPQRLADALLTAPGWTRVGLTAPNPRVRQRAVSGLADHLCDHLSKPGVVEDRAQLHLPL